MKNKFKAPYHQDNHEYKDSEKTFDKKMNAIKFLILVISLAIFYPPILKQYQDCETLRLKDEENKVTKIIYENEDIYVFQSDSAVWESPKLTDYREMFQRM